MYITNPNRRRRILAEERSRAAERNAYGESPKMELQNQENAESVQSQGEQKLQNQASQNQSTEPQKRDMAQENPSQSDTEGTNKPPLTGTGYVIVRVTTASGAIPLEYATVTIREYIDTDGDIIAVKETNLSGLTEKIPLPAPERTASLGAGRGKAYASYYVQVDKEGYAPQHYVNVPIFDGITAVQNADMVPLPENGEADRYNPYAGIFYESENPKLSGTQQ